MVQSQEKVDKDSPEKIGTGPQSAEKAARAFLAEFVQCHSVDHKARVAELPSLQICDDRVDGRHELPEHKAESTKVGQSLALEKFESSLKFSMGSTPERQHLLDGISKSQLIIERKEAMVKNIADLESRAFRDGLPRQEILNLYQNTSRLLDASEPSHPLNRMERAVLADQVIKNAAHPMAIDQGQHNTCNVTTVEARMYWRYPAEASRLVADVALNGDFVSASGSRIKIDAENLKPDAEASYNPAKPGERSFASQIFEITAANIHWQKRQIDVTGNIVDKGDLRYLQIPPVKSIPGDTGERLRNFHSSANGVTILGDDGKKALDPQLPSGPLQEISNEISGKDESRFVFDGKGGDSRVVSFDNPKQLHDELVKAKQQYPLIYVVHTSHEPFRRESGAKPSDAGGWHVINIIGYNPATKMIDMSNQWGPKSDHQISLETLYRASKVPEVQQKAR